MYLRTSRRRSKTFLGLFDALSSSGISTTADFRLCRGDSGKLRNRIGREAAGEKITVAEFDRCVAAKNDILKIEMCK